MGLELHDFVADQHQDAPPCSVRRVSGGDHRQATTLPVCPACLEPLSYLLSPTPNLVFCLKIYFILLQSQIYRVGDTERNILHPMIHSPSSSNGQSHAQPKPGASSRSPAWVQGSRLWAVLDCFPRPKAGSWMGSWAAGIRISAHMGSWRMQGKDLNHYAIAPGPKIK